MGIMSFSDENLKTIRPEIHLIISLARIHIGPKEKQRIENLLAEALDWAFFVDTADQHRVLPLVYRNIAENFSTVVPTYVLDRLRNWFHQNTIHNKVFERELSRISEYFKRFKIPIIFFKGPISAISIYDNIALRQFNDLDLLVHENDYYRAQNALSRLGYNKINDFGFEAGFQHELSQINVDLHQRFDYHGLYTELDFLQLFNRQQPTEFSTFRSPGLSIEDTLIILSVNFAKDFFVNKNKLSQISDIANLIVIHHNLDWPTVINRTGTCGTQRILFLCLLLSHQLLGTDLPVEVLQKIKAHPQVDSLVSEAFNRIISLLCGKSHFLDLAGAYIDEKIIHLKMKERLRDRISIYYQIVNHYVRHYFQKLTASVSRVVTPMMYRKV